MRKIFLVIFAAIIVGALILPSFADEISNALTDTNSTNATNESNVTNGTLGNNSTVNSTNSTILTPEQIQTLNNTQTKLTALIATIESLKATYAGNTKLKGLLNALDQFEKQANRLNAEITAFIQNPTANGADGIINSFVKRTAALEHKVMIKERLLQKMSTKQAKDKKNKQKKQKKNNGKNKGNN